MDINFRSAARAALTRAKGELGSSDDNRLKYAALELRFAMEAVTYDRALASKNEIPPDEYKTWQPRKLMQVLHDIDPHLGMTTIIRSGRQDDIHTPVPQERMRTLGTDVVFTLAELKKHYDAIGSYLHMPSLDQAAKDQSQVSVKLRERCQAVTTLMDSVLSSRVFNCTLGSFTTLPQCMNNDCKKPVRKRIPTGTTEMEVKCFECKAEYTVVKGDDREWLWAPKLTYAQCQTEGCSEKMALWPHEVRPGIHWTCKGCNKKYCIDLAVIEITELSE